jgi:hypothetical protein
LPLLGIGVEARGNSREVEGHESGEGGAGAKRQASVG